MVRASPIKTSFNAGEMSPKAYGRIDINRYGSALGLCENFIAEVQGGDARRSGSEFVAPTRYHNKDAMLVRFEFSAEQAYVLEFGDLYVRFYRNHGPLLESAKTITGATQANPVVITSNAHGFRNGDDVEVWGVGGMTELNNRRFRVANKTTNTFELNDLYGNPINGVTYTAFTSGGNVARVYTLTTTYQDGDLFQIKFAQSADVLYITHPEYVPRKLTRLGATSWQLTDLDFIDGPYLPQNVRQATLTPSAASGAGITITAGPSKAITGAANNGSGAIRITSAAHGWATGDKVTISGVTGTTEANGNWTVTRISVNTYDLQGSAFVNAYTAGGAAVPNLFAATDLGRLVRIQHSTTWGYARIVGFTSTNVVTADVINPFGGITASTAWRLGLYSQTGGYPAAVTFHQDRLALGGCPLDPSRADLSRTSLYEDFSPTSTASVVANDNAIQAPLNFGNVNVIRWMRSDEKGLLVGTTGGEAIIRPTTTGEALTPTNVNAVPATNYGSADVQCERVGQDVVFLQRNRRTIRNLSYVFEDDGFRAGDLTVLSEHITRPGCSQLAYQAQPNSVLWIVRDDGQLLSLTYSRDQEAVGWARHIMGGSSDSAGTLIAGVESVASIPAPDQSRDEVWLIVNRFINGNTVRSVEWLNPEWEQGDDQEQAWYLDCALAYDGAVSATLTPGAGATSRGATGVSFTAGSAVFAATDVGRSIVYRYYDSDAGTFRSAKAQITGYTSSTLVQATILAAFPSLSAIASAGWRMTANIITGLWHLEGQVISILADGATHPDKTVSAGAVTLDRQSAYVVLGLSCPARGRTLNIEAGAQDGTAQGKKKKIPGVVFRFHQTLGGRYGKDFDKMYPFQFRKGSDLMDNPPPIQDGDFPVTFPGGWDREGRICFEQDQPLPMTLLAIMPQVVTSDQG